MAEVSTSMDQLVGLLQKRGTVKVTDAAKELGTDKEHIESWAKMLEKADAVDVHYSVIGGALLKKGPKFDSVARNAIVCVPVEELRPRPRPSAAGMPSLPTSLPRRAESPGETAAEYALIRKKLEEEEQTLETDLRKLYEEQAAVVQYMNEVVAEGKKIAEYIETLRRIVERMGVDRRLPES